MRGPGLRSGLVGLLLGLAGPLAGQKAEPAARPSGADPLETLTLEEAIRRATSFDPLYIQALGRIDNAGWARRAAITSFVVPSIQASGSFTRFSSESFNIGTAELTSQLAQANLQGTLPLFEGGARFAELDRSRAELEASEAGEVQALYQTALDTETDFYGVLSGKELVDVARGRVRRAEEQLAVARARVTSGAAVQTDSLQLLLELTRARVDLLSEESALRVAQFQLGRRVGAEAPVDAERSEPWVARALPLGEEAAVAEALSTGPDYQTAAAEERAAQSALSVERSAYLPQVSLNAQISSFDDRLFPDATVRSSAGISVSIPVWNGAQREIRISQARVARDVARASREDIERGVRRDVVQAYTAYETARASVELSEQAVAVATENLRVQESRYRSGATTILDLITAQVDLADAEAGLVQATYSTRLALAGLEALLGRRLFPDRVEP